MMQDEKTSKTVAGYPYGRSMNVIPYPADYDTTSSGGSSFQNKGDHLESPYFSHPDFYHMTSTDTLTILPGFKTYQQTTEYTCGTCAALMVLNYFGNTDWKEFDMGKIMGSVPKVGTNTAGMVRFFNQIGWDVQSSPTDGRLPQGATFEDPKEFRKWVLENLKAGLPIMVEWLDWGGHWQVIIGYDTMGTDSISDDVVIFADSYDTTDHLQDGYYIFPAERFYNMWHDLCMLPKEASAQQWVVAKPKK